MHKIYNDNAINDLHNAISSGIVNMINYKFPESYAIKCGKFYIRSHNGEAMVEIDSNISKNYINSWYSTSIRILLKDIRNKTLDDYYFVELDGIFYLIKKLSEDDINYLKKKNVKDVVDFNICTDNYAVISISKNIKFSYECFDNYDELDYNYDTQNTDFDENGDDDISLDSLQLFDESDMPD